MEAVSPTTTKSSTKLIQYEIDHRLPPPLLGRVKLKFPWTHYSVTISGGGWLNSDHGKALNKQFLELWLYNRLEI